MFVIYEGDIIYKETYGTAKKERTYVKPPGTSVINLYFGFECRDLDVMLLFLLQTRQTLWYTKKKRLKEFPIFLREYFSLKGTLIV